MTWLEGSASLLARGRDRLFGVHFDSELVSASLLAIIARHVEFARIGISVSCRHGQVVGGD